MPIGVFDSGLGGLTILRGLADALPNQSFVYLGDNASAPYGVRQADDVYALTVRGVERLMAEGCALVVVACNTACALGLRRLQQEWLPSRVAAAGEAPPRALGVFAPMVEAITGRDWTTPGPAAPAAVGRRVVVFATPATAASGAFEREAAARAPELSVESVACAGLVDAIEAGDAARSDAIAERAARSWADRTANAERVTAVLGCTHYPLVEAAFRRGLGPVSAVLHQPSVVAASLARYLARRPGYEDRDGGVALLTTADPAVVSERSTPFLGRRARFVAA